MSVPLSQMATVVRYVLAQRLRGVKRYPLVLMLEPLFRCNLACGGCGKIQFPARYCANICRRKNALPRSRNAARRSFRFRGRTAFASADAGDRGGLNRTQEVRLLVHERDQAGRGPAAVSAVKVPRVFRSHGRSARGSRCAVCREGVYDVALAAIRAARARGFRVTTNTTVFSGVHPPAIRAFFDEMMRLGVEGMMISPGYSYEKAPDQDHFSHGDKR